MLKKYLWILPTFLAFGVGSPAELPEIGGLFVIEVYEQQPPAETLRKSPNIILFGVEL